MEYQRILCTFLYHESTHISQSTRQVLPALLSHSYNPEGLSRSIVATIARELSSLNEELEFGLSIDEVQNYWFAITLDYQPASSGHGPYSLPTPNNTSITSDTSEIERLQHTVTANAYAPEAGHLNGAFSHSPSVAHHPNPNVDLLLATAYNNVIFTWITDFLLYPLKKRADLLVPRQRTHSLPRRHESSGKDDESSLSRPSKRLHRLPRRTPPPTANGVRDEPMQTEGENTGLEGCKIINNVNVDADHLDELMPRQYSSESAYAQWNGADTDFNGNDLFGEALELRVGKYREKLKQDLIRRDGPLCAASKQPTETLFCTQVIPESADPHRFFRFRRMVSVFFAGQYDHLLEPPSSSSQSNTTSMGAMEVDHSLGPSPSLENRRSKRRGHYPTPDNILRTSRNTINLSEKWMRWLDEGRFAIRERGGQFFIICLDPTLNHDPSFSRQGVHPNDPWESAHWLRLEIGATSTRTEVSHPPLHSTRLPPISNLTAGVPNEVVNGLPPLSSVTSAHQQQLPTPTPTPTSPPPSSSIRPLRKQDVSYPETGLKGWRFGGQSQGQKRPEVMQSETHQAKRTAPPLSVSSRLLKRIADRSSSPRSTHPHPYAPKLPSHTAPTHSRWQSHSELHDIHNQSMHSRLTGSFATGPTSRQAHSHSRTASASSNTTNYSVTSTTSTMNPSRRSIASLLNPPALNAPLLVQSNLPSSLKHSIPSSNMLPKASPPTSTFAIPTIRKELWDVDALDVNLVRLHEQILTAWWATGLAPEVNTQMNWVDHLPLPEMNMVVLGQPGFTSVLKHKLTLL